jgi:hypothetical protein
MCAKAIRAQNSIAPYMISNQHGNLILTPQRLANPNVVLRLHSLHHVSSGLCNCRSLAKKIASTSARNLLLYFGENKSENMDVQVCSLRVRVYILTNFGTILHVLYSKEIGHIGHKDESQEEIHVPMTSPPIGGG